MTAIVCIVSSQTGYTHHMRYIMPALPFAFIWVSKIAQAVDFKNKVVAFLGGGAFLWSVGSSLWVYPHSLSYFNELVGGPMGGHEHLLESNIDWGQDLLYLDEWLNEHPEARPLGLAYFGLCDPRVLGLIYAPPPRHVASSSAAVSGRVKLGQ